MPSRNVEKIFLEDSFYHIYNRGVNKRRIFLDKDDYAVFLNLLQRYLDSKPTKDNKGREYAWLYPELELLAFCLMPNHFHLLTYQHSKTAMTKLLLGVSTAYTMYFNKKYERLGPLYQESYRASRIDNEVYLQHITRYIHLNPGVRSYRNWEFSSLPYYIYGKEAGWIQPHRIIELFDDIADYKNFVNDYEEYKEMLDDVKSELAN